MKSEVNFTFTADNTIKAIFGAWSASPGQNMTWRHVLTLPYAVGVNDQLTIRVTDHLARGT